jgi:UDP-glucose 4-epimerase
VTGGSGRVGRHVLPALADGYDVVNVDLVSVPGFEHTFCDVMDLDQVRAATRGADAVVHLAAIDFDWQAAPEEYLRVNVQGSWHVLQAAVENNLRKVVLCSSVSACGLSEMRADWMPRFLPVDETHEDRPVHAYSVSKHLIERMGRSVSHGSPVEVICLRPLAVVLSETLPEFVQSIDAPDRHWLFYYVTAADLGRAFRAAVDVAGLRFDTFFLSAPDTTRPEPTLHWYAERIGSLPELRNPRAYALDSRASIFSSARARERLGWEASSNFLDLRRAAGLPPAEAS